MGMNQSGFNLLSLKTKQKLKKTPYNFHKKTVIRRNHINFTSTSSNSKCLIFVYNMICGAKTFR